MATNTETTPGLPTRQPGDFASLAARTASTSGQLAAAAEKARQAPGTWVFVSFTNADGSNHSSWASDVRAGSKVSLGQLAEQWDAEVVRGYYNDDGQFVVDDEYHSNPVYAKFIAYLGLRANNGEVN